MALPKRGDPRRPLLLAASSMLSLGVLLLLLSGCTGYFVFIERQTGAWAELIVMAVFYVAPGIGLIVASIFLKRYKPWAVIVGIVLTALLILGTIFIAFSSLLFSGPLVGGTGMLIIGGVALLFVLAFTQLILQLVKSFGIIREHGPGQEPQGFELIMGEQVEPIE
ncbi:MAG: hypothetical protein AAF656_08450 [Planctomycetota bacterium]